MQNDRPILNMITFMTQARTSTVMEGITIGAGCMYIFDLRLQAVIKYKSYKLTGIGMEILQPPFK